MTVNFNKTCGHPLKLNLVFYVRIFLVALKMDGSVQHRRTHFAINGVKLYKACALQSYYEEAFFGQYFTVKSFKRFIVGSVINCFLMLCQFF